MVKIVHNVYFYIHKNCINKEYNIFMAIQTNNSITQNFSTKIMYLFHEWLQCNETENKSTVKKQLSKIIGD